MTSYYNENDPACISVLRRHMETGNLPDGVIDDRDIREVRPADVAGYDECHFFAGIGGFPLGFKDAGLTPAVGTVWTGGFPCQDVSVAGNRAGLAGERSGLWFEFLRLLTGVKPEWVVIENVPGLLSSNKGRDFVTLLRGLVECGYGVCWRVLDAQYFGVAQRRRRVFLVGYLGGGRAAEVLFERESSAGNPKTRREAGQGAAASLKASPPSRRNGGSEPIPGELITEGSTRGTLGAAAGRNRGVGQENETSFLVTGAVTSKWAKGHRWTCYEVVDLITSAIDARNSRSNGEVSGTLQAKKSGGYSLNYQNPIAFEWNRSAGSERTRIVRAGDYAQIRPSAVDAIVFNTTQITSKENGSNPQLGDPSHSLAATNHPPALAREGGVRRLTPTECERLQGFPDGWTDGQSDSVRYKQLGNALAVVHGKWIGKQIMKAMEVLS